MKTLIIPMLAALLPAAAMAQAGPADGMTLDQYMARALPRMMAADTDGDGRISKAEAEAMGRGGGERIFDRADANHDGILDKAEIQAALARRFQRMDANGDGVVTAEERAARRGRAGGPRGDRGDAMPPAAPSAPQ